MMNSKGFDCQLPYQSERLLAPWQSSIVKLRSECSEEEVYAELAEYVREDLARAGPSDDVKRKGDDLGGFRKTHVS